MGRSISFGPEEFYHLYNRGTEKRKIFMNGGDRDRFLALLYLCNQSQPADLKYQGRTLSEIGTEKVRRGEPLVDIVSYCLMPNHFHFLVRERQEGGISKFMQKLTTGYTMYFNRRHERSGALFQGKFKATHVNDDRYLQYLISYVHLNPVKLIEPLWKETGIVDRERAEKYLEQYAYSSYLDYRGRTRPENILLERSILPQFSSSGNDFKTYVTEWLTYKSQ